MSTLLQVGLATAELIEPVEGAITPSIAIESLAFLRVYDSLPNVDVVRADPNRAHGTATAHAGAVILVPDSPARFWTLPRPCRLLDTRSGRLLLSNDPPAGFLDHRLPGAGDRRGARRQRHGGQPHRLGFPDSFPRQFRRCGP